MAVATITIIIIIITTHTPAATITTLPTSTDASVAALTDIADIIYAKQNQDQLTEPRPFMYKNQMHTKKNSNFRSKQKNSLS